MAGVCLIGTTVARELFGDQSPIGQTLRVNNTPLSVIGVLERKGANTFGADQDDIVLAPWRTIKFKVSGQSAQTTNQSAAAAGSAAGVSSTTRFPSQQPSPYPAQTVTEASDFPTPPLATYVDQILVRIGTEGEIPARSGKSQRCSGSGTALGRTSRKTSTSVTPPSCRTPRLQRRG